MEAPSIPECGRKPGGLLRSAKKTNKAQLRAPVPLTTLSRLGMDKLRLTVEPESVPDDESGIDRAEANLAPIAQRHYRIK
jgi:hypothetical protein